jgi:hypothetical protein
MPSVAIFLACLLPNDVRVNRSQVEDNAMLPHGRRCDMLSVRRGLCGKSIRSSVCMHTHTSFLQFPPSRFPAVSRHHTTPHLPADQVILQRASPRMPVNATGMHMLAHLIDGVIHGIGSQETVAGIESSQLTQDFGFRLDVLPNRPDEGFSNI